MVAITLKELLDNKYLKETIIWLTGLISTDGSIVTKNIGNGYQTSTIHICSSEEDWLSQIQNKLKRANLSSAILGPYSYENRTFKNAKPQFILNVHHPRLIYFLIEKYGKEYIMKRKFNKLVSSYGSNNYYWSFEEMETLMNLKEPLNRKEILKNFPQRTIHAVRMKRWRIGKGESIGI